MKKIITVLFILVPCVGWAEAPSTTCPTNSRLIDRPYIILSDSACPAGTIEINSGPVSSCLEGSEPEAMCYMYALANTPYTDQTGTYEFTSICPLE